MSPLHLIVTCSAAKRDVPAEGLQAAAVKAQSLEERCQRWIERLAAEPASRLRLARDLYRGGHWSVVRDVLEMAGKVRPVQGWIVSAGYGLITTNSPVAPYAATFTPREADWVGRGLPVGSAGEVGRSWWKQLTMPASPEVAGKPGCLAGLFHASEGGTVVAALPAHYLEAVQDDLVAGLAGAGDRSHFLLISSAKHCPPALREFLVPVDTRLQASLGGTRSCLHARILREVVRGAEQTHFGVEQVREQLQRLVESQPVSSVLEQRQKATDSEVRSFIESALKAGTPASYSRLLREFRDAGRACEMRRFATLFREAQRYACHAEA